MRREPAVLCAAALVLTTAACSSGDGGSGGATSAPPSTTAPPTSSAPPSPSSSSSAAPTATVTDTVTPPASSSASSVPTGPGRCTNDDLTISASQGNGATGHNRYVLYFHNTSTRTCTLYGYPGLDALAASGSVLAHARRTLSGFMGGSRRGIPTVPVEAGQDASAIVEWETIQPGTGDACDKQSARIAVTAADTTRAAVLDRSVTACSLQIHPTVPGRSGDLT